tara:strand:- start:5863 stop:6291 length:429 start_codon:yes stop_codon:yes gene_type:complete
VIASADERIAIIQGRLDKWKPYGSVMGLMAKMYDGEEDAKVFTDAPQLDNIKNFENNIKLVKTEKLVYLAILARKPNKAIFPMLLAKYDDLMGLSYDISGNMVLNGISPEGDHLEYCKESLSQREYIRKMCEYGEKYDLINK